MAALARIHSPTLTDCSISGNVDDARAELNRALDRLDEQSLAAWARKWGAPIVRAAEAHAADQEDARFPAVEEDDYTDILQDAANDAVANVTELLDKAPATDPDLVAGLRNAIADLKAAL